MDPHARSAYRFLTNLWWRPMSIWIIVEYWLSNYEPLARETRALAPASLDPGEYLYTLLVRVIQGPDDICLVGQGGMALTSNADEPRYIHVLNFMKPAASDYTLAIPVRHFLSLDGKQVPQALLPLYLESSGVWKRSMRTPTMGEHRFEHFHLAGDVLAWRSLFPAVAFAAEIVYRRLWAMRTVLSAEWCSTDGLAVIARWMDAFRGSELWPDSLFAESEQTMVSEYRTGMAQALSMPGSSGLQRFEQCLRVTRELRIKSQAMTRACYLQIKKTMDCAFCMDDAPHLPWNKNEGEDEDAMDIDSN